MAPQPILINGALVVTWLAFRHYWRQILRRGTPLVALEAAVHWLTSDHVLLGYGATFIMWLIAATFWIGCLRVLMLNEARFGADAATIIATLLRCVVLIAVFSIGIVLISVLVRPIGPAWLGLLAMIVCFVALIDVGTRATLVVSAAAVGKRVRLSEAWRRMEWQSWRLIVAALLIVGPIMLAGSLMTALVPSAAFAAILSATLQLVEVPSSAAIAAYALRQRLGLPLRGLGET